MFQSQADDREGMPPEWLNVRGLGETQVNPLIRYTAPNDTWNRGAHNNPNIGAASMFGNDTTGLQGFFGDPTSMGSTGGLKSGIGRNVTNFTPPGGYAPPIQATMPYLQTGHDLNPDVIPEVKNIFENIPREDLVNIIEDRQDILPELPISLRGDNGTGRRYEVPRETATPATPVVPGDGEPPASGDPRSRADINLLMDTILEKLLGVGTYTASPYSAPSGGIGEFLARGR